MRAVVYKQSRVAVRCPRRMMRDKFPQMPGTAHSTVVRRAGPWRTTNCLSEFKQARSLLKRLQVFEQFLFVPVRQLGAVNVTLVAVPFFSRVEKKIRLR